MLDELPTLVGRLLTAAATAEQAYQQEIRAQLVDRDVLPDGPLSLELAFVVGPGRDWVDLWKPTIDALGPLLGETNRPWHPKDGRIVDLGLHGSVEPGRGDGVLISMRMAGAPWTTADALVGRPSR